MYQRECYDVLHQQWQQRQQGDRPPVTLRDGDVINSHALDVHIDHIYQDWVESIGPALKMIGYPKWGDLNERILASHWLAKGLNLKKRLH